MAPTPKPSFSTPASGNTSSLVLPTPSSSIKSTRQQLERQIAEHEKQLQESSSGIGKNVLIRQISQLKERLQQMDQQQQQQQQQKPQQRRPTDDNPPVLDKLRSLERDMTSYRSPRLLSSHPIPSPSTSGLDSSSLLPLPPPPTGSTPTKRRSKVPNADRRNTDIEFATEIGQGLLLEVRKMQALLQEKDEQLNQLEIQKADLERAAEAMAKQLRQREEVEERLKEDTWNLELAKQELTISVTELQQNLHKSTAEQNRLQRQMNELRSEIERLRSSEEKLNGIVENMKQRHEQDMSSVRRHAAGLQREKLDQKKQIDALTSELAIAKAQTRIAKRSYSEMHVAAKPEQPAPLSSDASTDREQSPKASPPPSPKQTPTRNQQLEVETLKTSLAHAHRMVSNLRSNLHKEKTEKFELKKLLAESQETIEQLQNEPRMWEDTRDTTDVKRSHRSNGTNKRRKGSTRRKGQRVGVARVHKGEIEEVESFTDNDDDDSAVTSSDEEDYISKSMDGASAGFTSLSSELSMSHPPSTSLGDQLSMALSSASPVQPRSTVDMGTQTDMATDSTETVSPLGLQVVAMPAISAIPAETMHPSVPVDAGITVDITKQAPPSKGISTQTSPITMVPGIGFDSAIWTSATDGSNVQSVAARSSAAQLDTTHNDVPVLSSEATSVTAFGMASAQAFENVPTQGAIETTNASQGSVDKPIAAVRHDVSPAETSSAKALDGMSTDASTLPSESKPILQGVHSGTFVSEATQAFDTAPNLELSTYTTGVDLDARASSATDSGVPVTVAYNTVTTATFDAPPVASHGDQTAAGYSAQTTASHGVPATKSFGTETTAAYETRGEAADGAQATAALSTPVTAADDDKETTAHDILSTTGHDGSATAVSGAQATYDIKPSTVDGVQAIAAHETQATAPYHSQAIKAHIVPVTATDSAHITAAHSIQATPAYSTQATAAYDIPATAVYGTQATEAYSAPITAPHSAQVTAAHDAPQVAADGVPMVSAAYSTHATTAYGVSATGLSQAPVDDARARPVYSTQEMSSFSSQATPAYSTQVTATPVTMGTQNTAVYDTPPVSVHRTATFGTAPTAAYGVPVTTPQRSAAVFETTATQSFENVPTVHVSKSTQAAEWHGASQTTNALPVAASTSLQDGETTHVAYTPKQREFSTVQTSSHYADVVDHDIEEQSSVRGYGDSRRAPQYMAHDVTPQSAMEQMNGEPRTLTQSEADAMVARAVEAALNAYRKQEKAAAAASDDVEEEPPARPSSPPPSTLLSKAAARSASVNNRIAAEQQQEEYGTAYVNPHTMMYSSRRRESGSMSSISTSNTTTERRPSITSSQLEAAARTVNSISDPNAIALITQTMIGDWMWKYTRKAVGNGLSERRHKRFFWIHPYTRTLYWSPHAPGVDGRESKAKSAFIEDVQAIPDYTQNSSGLPHISLLIQTPGRQLKITAPDTSRHEVWYESLSYLLERAGADGTSKKSIDRRDITESVSTSAVSILKKPSFQRLRPVRSISSIAGSARSMSSRSRVEDDDDDDEGLEDVRMCCNGKHHVSKLEKDHHHHQPHHYRNTTKRSQLSS